MDASNSNYLRQTAEQNKWFTYLSNLIWQRRNFELTSILNSTPSMKNIVDTTDQTLLYVATKCNNISIMQYLLESHCDINAKDIFGWTPLMIAAKSGDAGPLMLLLNCNADIFLTNSNNQSALQIYFNVFHRKRSLQVLNKFFEKVVQCSRSNDEIFAKLSKAKCRLSVLVHLRNPQVIKIFLDHQCHIEDSESNYSVANCINFMYKENLRMLLQYGANVEQRRRASLHYIYSDLGKPKLNKKTDLEKIKFFVDLLVDLKFLNEDTYSFACLLFLQSTEEQLQIVMQSGINDYIRSEFNFEPIVYIFGNRNPNVLEFIQRSQIDVEARGWGKTTALHLAVDATLDNHVKYLLDMGVDANITDECGDTPIFFVFDDERDYEYDETCLLLLLKHGADLQHCNDEGKTFIEYVVYNEECANIFAVIFAHLAMLQSSKVSIDETFIEFINSQEDLATFYGTMCQQLKEMKTHELCGNVTLFTALTESIEYLSRRVRSLDLYTTDKLYFYIDYKLDAYHSYYTDILCDRVLTAYEICKSRERAVIVICDCIEVLKPYFLVVDKICSYLSHEDLRRIAHPFQKSSKTKEVIERYDKWSICC